MKKISIFILLIFILLLNINCKNKEYGYKTYYLEEAFSIVPVITILDEIEIINNLNIENNLNEITKQLDTKYNVFNENSLISKINKSSGISEVQVDEEFIYIIKQAINISKQTEINNKSLYDISIFSIWKEWDFQNNYYQYYNYKSPPNNEIIKQKLPLVDYNNIIINEEQKTIFLKEKEMMIDLGSIVKGYAAEKIAEYLLSLNLKNTLIDIGGNIITTGKNIGTNNNWKVGILLPYTVDTEIGYIISNDQKETFVTSGIYQRYIVDKNQETNEEKMYHHILNPTTGYPEDNDLLSVTIITKDSMIADAYSTAVFLMGSSKGIEFVNNNNNLLGAIFITKNKQIILSNNIKNRFIINEEIYKLGYYL